MIYSTMSADWTIQGSGVPPRQGMAGMWQGRESGGIVPVEAATQSQVQNLSQVTQAVVSS